MGHYQEIQALWGAAAADKKINDRRKALGQLVNKLSNSQVLYALYDEVQKGRADIVARQEFMTSFWKSVFSSAMSITSSESASGTKKSVKLKNTDYEIPRRLIKLYINMLDDENLDPCLRPYPAAECVEKIYTYVINLLAASATADDGKLVLFETLLLICRSSTLVNEFKERWISEILAEVGEHVRESPRGRIGEKALNVLVALVQRCVQLGIDMEKVMSEVFALISDHLTQVDHKSTLTVHLVSCVAKLLRRHPDQGVGALPHFPIFFNKARKLYGAADVAEKDVVVEYLTAHLIVSQLKAELTGLRPGDLGHLEAASLSPKRVESLLDMLTGDKAILSTMELSVSGWQRTKGVMVEWTTLTDRQKRHLELCARLFAVAQRQFLAAVEWEPLAKDCRILIDQHDWTEDEEYSEELKGSKQPLSVSVLAKSPWARVILSPLLASLGTRLSEPNLSMTDSSSVFSLSQGSASAEEDGFLSSFDLLTEIRSAASTPPSPRRLSIIPLLQVLSACAECFPFGECWASVNAGGWKSFPPFDDKTGIRHFVKTSTVDDLGAIMAVLCAHLEDQGGPTGDGTTCGWLLLCLTKLASASWALHESLAVRTHNVLQDVWHRIWLILTRPDLQYSVFTRSTHAGSLGHMVLQLILDVSRYCCGDEFLRRHQRSIWSLPAFRATQQSSSPVLYDTVSAIVYEVGLVDELHPTCVIPAPTTGWDDSLRHRLLCMGVDAFLLSCRQSDQCPCLEAIAFMIRALVGVSQTPRAPEADSAFELTMVSSSVAVESAGARSVFTLLWRSTYPTNTGDGLSSWDDVVVNLLRRRDKLLDKATKRTSPDFVSVAERDKVLPKVLDMLVAGATESLVHLGSQMHVPSIHAQLLKLVLGLIDGDDYSSDLVDRAWNLSVEWLTGLLEHLVSEYASLCEQPRLLRILLQQVYQIFVAMTISTQLFERFRNSNQVHEISEKLFDSFSKLLVNYWTWRKLGRVHVSKADKARRSSRDDFFDDDADDSMVDDIQDVTKNADTDESDSSLPARRKRPSTRGPTSLSKRRRTDPRVATNRPPDVNSALQTGFVLISLRPTAETCKFVYQHVGLFEAEDYELNVGAAELDPTVTLSLVELVANDFHNCSDEESLLFFCLAAQSDVRHYAKARKGTFLKGYSAVQRLLTRSPDNKEEREMLLDAMASDEKAERRILSCRALAASAREEAATAAFQVGDSQFHAVYDSTYAGHFVFNELSSLSAVSRRHAQRALACFLSTMSRQDNIIKSTVQELAVGEFASTGEGLSRALNRFDQEVEYKWASELSVSWKASVLGCWGVLSGVTTSEDLARDLLFDLLVLASEHPVLEPHCAILIARIAELRSAVGHEAFLSAERFHLLCRWCRERRKLGSLPLVLLAPKVVEALVETAGSLVETWTKKGQKALKKLREAAVTEFVNFHAGLLLPIIVSEESIERSVLSLSTHASSDSVPGHGFGGQLFEAVKILTVGDDEQEGGEDSMTQTVQSELKKYATDLTGHGLAQLLLDESDVRGQRALNEGTALLDPDNQAVNVRACLIRSMRALADQGGSIGGYDVLVRRSLDKLAELGSTDADIFLTYGLSALEHLVNVHDWFARNPESQGTLSLFLSVCESVLVNGKKDSGKLFLLSMSYLREILGQPMYSVDVKLVVLSWLKDHVTDIIAALQRAQNHSVELQLFAVGLMRVHAQFQEAIVEECTEHWHTDQKNTRRSLGLLHRGSGMHTDVWGWESTDFSVMVAVSRFQALVKPSHFDVLSSTFEIVNRLLAKLEDGGCEMPWLRVPLFRESDESKALAAVARTYSLQQQVAGHASHRQSLDTKGVSALFLEAYSCFSDVILREQSPETVLLAELLACMQETMVDDRSISLSSNVYEAACNFLKRPQSPTVLKVAASRLIGHSSREKWKLELHDVDQINLPKSLWQTHNGALQLDCRGIIDSFRSKCVENLVRFIQVGRKRTAKAAVEACEAILNAGTDCLSTTQDKGAKALLASLCHETRKAESAYAIFAEASLQFLEEANCWQDKWWTLDNDSAFAYSDWIRKLVCCLIWGCFVANRDDQPSVQGFGGSFFVRLPKMCWLEPDFAETIFPWLLVGILLGKSSQQSVDTDKARLVCGKRGQICSARNLSTQLLSNRVTKMLSCCLESTNPDSRRVVALFASTLDLLRRLSQEAFRSNPTHRKNRGTAKPASQPPSDVLPFWTVLDIPPDLVVKSFLCCGRVFSASFFAELYLNRPRATKTPMDKEVLLLFWECSRVMKEKDVANALALKISAENFFDFDSDMLGNHGKNANGNAKNLDALRSLAVDGTREDLAAYIDGLTQGHRRLVELSPDDVRNVREVWFQQTLWDSTEAAVSVSLPTTVAPSGFFENLSIALGAFGRDDFEELSGRLTLARNRVFEDVADFEALSRFRVLNYVEWYASHQIASLQPEKEFSEFLSSNDEMNADGLIFAVRANMLSSAAKKLSESSDEKSDAAEDGLRCHLWTGALAKHSVHSERALWKLQSILRGKHVADPLIWMRIRYQECVLLEARGDYAAAVQGCTQLIEHLEGAKCNTSQGILADSLLSCGEWTKTYGVGSSKQVREKYLIRAVKTSLQCSDASTLATSRTFRAHLALAEISSRLFENTMTRLRSAEWGSKMDYLESLQAKKGENERAIKSLSPKGRVKLTKAQLSEKNQQLSKLMSDTRLIDREITVILDEKKQEEAPIKKYLQGSLEQFGRALCIHSGHAESTTKAVIGMVLLWFSAWQNFEFVNETMDKLLPVIPSHFFVPLTYQIFARLDQSDDSSFQGVLCSLVSRMVEEHPYHCIVQLITLSNGSMKNGRLSQDSTNSKADAAESIIEDLERMEGSTIGSLLHSYDEAIMAYIALAVASTKVFEGKRQLSGIKMSEVLKDRGKKRLDTIFQRQEYKPCIFTMPPALQTDRNYGSGKVSPPGTALIKGFEPAFNIAATGVSRPKVVYCQGSDGQSYKQLVKKDEIRQDAVMQQVFRFVNALMRKEERESLDPQRKLKLVTYQAIPLSPDTGVLEWVLETCSFGSTIITRSSKTIGLHDRYYPGQWANRECRAKMEKAIPSTKRKTFDEVCDNFSPSFRYFFVERFGDDHARWHAAKMDYTRSCAVCSIVGSMLGIGDRHAENVLIHERTGEMVLIDFGIVFEQGKKLPTPETVPFRLTRNVVDGMGPCGTDGPFSRAAEETTRVLRENQAALLTILSAIVADPLFQWSETAAKAGKKQRDEAAQQDTSGIVPIPMVAGIDQNENETGVAVISKIQQKLQGIEEGTASEKQSVEGQVRHLIIAARDPDNLSVLYWGWAPWL